LLTPLSTIIGYCELLLEEAPSNLLPDLKQIYNPAQELLSLVNSLDSLMTSHLQSVQTINADELNATAWQRRTTPGADQSLVAKHNRILVIDSTSNSSVFRQLERQNYPVELATTGEQALQILAANSYDLILLDISQMGLKVLEQLKSREEWQQISVLIISAADETTLMMEAIALGATDYLTKPIPSTLLWAKVTACLEQTQLRQQLVHYEGIVAELQQYQQIADELNQQIEALQLELEQIKRSQQVAEIVQTDYFQHLQPNVEAQEPNLPPSDPLPLKVLLVEDNELNSDMLSRRLQRYGYEVVLANDGAEGVAKALSEQPQVILMDISLPVMDGWEATQQLKANPQTSRIPIIALTAHAMTGDREKALASGCDDYDTKPIELPRLLSKIEDCLKSLTSN
jgi:CheY-like chemotaxis protein